MKEAAVTVLPAHRPGPCLSPPYHEDRINLTPAHLHQHPMKHAKEKKPAKLTSSNALFPVAFTVHVKQIFLDI